MSREQGEARFDILQFFSVASFVAILIVGAAVTLLYRHETKQLLEIAEGRDEALAQTFANSIWPRFAGYVSSVSGLDGNALRSRPETALIDEAVRQLMQGTPALKAKIYNLDGLTVFSSVASEIGADKSGNPGFQAARRGEVKSKITRRGRMSAFEGAVQNRDVNESYLPVRRDGGPVEGVIELYTDVTELARETRAFQRTLVVGPVLIFGTLYAVLFLVVRYADSVIKNQYRNVLRDEEELREKNAALRREMMRRERIETKLRDHMDMQKLIGTLSASFIGARPEEVGARIDDAVTMVGHFTGADRCYIYLLGADRRTMTLSHEWRAMGAVPESARPPEFQVGDLPWLVGQLRDRRPVRLSDPADLPPEARAERAAFARHGVRAVLVVPMMSAGAFIGCLGLESLTPRHLWRRQDVGLLSVVGGIISSILERTRAERALRRSEERLRARVAELQDAKDRLERQGKQLRDLTDDLARARDDATHANRAKSEFLAHMSHELRSPLNAVLGFSEIMCDELFGKITPERYREYAADIHVSGSHLLELINDLLDLSKIEAGKLELCESEVDVARLVAATLRLVRGRAGKAGLNLGADIPDDLPALFADERMVKQMLLNLLTNSVKFTPSGGRVRVSARIDDDGRLALTVNDTGCGIPPDEINRVLEAYVQGSSELARRGQEGTGLGLPLVRRMAELHGGSIELESEINVGTSATIYFPRARVANGRAEAPLASTG